MDKMKDMLEAKGREIRRKKIPEPNIVGEVVEELNFQEAEEQYMKLPRKIGFRDHVDFLKYCKDSCQTERPDIIHCDCETMEEEDDE